MCHLFIPINEEMKVTAMLSSVYPLTVSQQAALKGQRMETCTIFDFPKHDHTNARKALIQSITPHFHEVIFSVHLFTNSVDLNVTYFSSKKCNSVMFPRERI